MRVTLIFPPSLCLPNPIYFSLPLLAGALKQAGHEVSLVDLNVLAMDRLLTPEWGARILAEARRAVERQSMAGTPGSFQAILDENEPIMLEAPSCKETLRHRVRNFEPAAFRHAFSTVIKALDFCYMLDPVISPHRDGFGRDVIAHQELDPWSPLKDLYDEVLLDEALRSDPALVGITVAFPEQAAEAVRLAAKLRRRNKDLHICFGGPLVSLFPEPWFKEGWLFRYADSVVVGDGETAVVELADALEGNGDMDRVHNRVRFDPHKGVCWNNRELFFEEMDNLPVPDFDPADLSLYLTPEPLYPLMLSRGCRWGRCAFCSSGWYKRFRCASEEKIYADLKSLTEKYHARYIMLQDSNVPTDRALYLARIIREEQLPVYWYGTVRLDDAFLDANYCRELGDGGCRSFLLGFESANQHVIDLMCKGFQLENVPLMLKNLREAGISAELLWFVGFPTETLPDALRTARFLVDHKKMYGLAALVGEYQLHPDTRVFRRPQDFGVTITQVVNGNGHYTIEKGMNMEEKRRLLQLFAGTGNRTLVCNGAHLPHLVENGIDLSGIEQPMQIPPEAIAFCSE
ncbi:MAG: radical SAM protein [Planctomycetota bacterium]